MRARVVDHHPETTFHTASEKEEFSEVHGSKLPRVAPSLRLCGWGRATFSHLTHPIAAFVSRICHELLRLATARISENFVGLLLPAAVRPSPCDAPYFSP